MNKEPYKLIIVDDEPIILEGLSSYNWRSFNFQLIGTASNGAVALELMKQQTVDVIITDIKMPVMDGMELSKAVKQLHPQCKIVIITGHKDFEYARGALQIGVSDYLLKPIELTELDQLIIELRVKFDEERARSKQILTYQLQLEESLPVAGESFFRSLLDGGIQDPNEIEEKMTLLEISMTHSYYFCLIVQTETKKDVPQADALQTIQDVIMEALNPTRVHFYIIQNKMELNVILNFDMQGTRSPHKYIMDLVAKLDSAMKICFISTPYQSYFIGVGEVYQNIRSLSQSYQKAGEAIQRRFFEEQRRIFYAWTDTVVLPDELPRYPYELEGQLISAVLEGDTLHCALHFQSFWDHLNPFFPRMNLPQVYTIMIQLFNMLERRLNLHGTSMENLVQLTPPFFHAFSRMKTLSQLRLETELLLTKITALILEQNDSVKTSSHLAVLQAKKFIEAHYHEKITLQQVANLIYLNPSYFSIQFKKEVGINFIDYIKECRMLKAKEYLRRIDLKVYEIGEMVGYHNRKYFTDTFKEYTGLTPLEYRHKIIKS